MAASDMRNRLHVQPLLTWSTDSSCIPGLGVLTGYYQPGQLSPGTCLKVPPTMKISPSKHKVKASQMRSQSITYTGGPAGPGVIIIIKCYNWYILNIL
ncbi:hypothetical protein LAZ67_3005288 [Cordylochernes scorpioides]|uniref:Uncharacterized protein n=1 Tax=Cordylochernes scorpioides TaxID=51811 RepID=A0ABY6KBJ4_9ARAC|nr:hypothetical protein LAZ67_3005288 [Cordylochernes scorpioides]